MRGLVQRCKIAVKKPSVPVARGDALASGLPRTYLCEQNSTNFTVTDPVIAAVTSVVEVSGQSVVVHKVF